MVNSSQGCPQCWPEDAEQADAAIRQLPIGQRLVDEAHFIVLLRACPACRQGFLQITTEQVDWRDGEDPLERITIPVTVAEYESLVQSRPPGAGLLEGIGVGRRSLHFDWPKGQPARTTWRTGVQVGPHD